MYSVYKTNRLFNHFMNELIEYNTTMQPSDFNIDIPTESIAQTPLKDRSSSKLLHLKDDVIDDRNFSDIPHLIKRHDLLILNNTKVLPARLFGKKESGGKVEIFFERLLDEMSFIAQLKFSGKVHIGTEIIISEGTVFKITKREQQFFTITSNSSVMDILYSDGLTPLPPYIKRGPNLEDRDRYQTVFAKKEGAVAAPTAGLHFTDILLDELRAQGIQTAELTLSVSSGTFRDVEVDDITQHEMDPEHYDLSAETAEKIRDTKARGNRVVAIGTTVAKTLETVAQNNNGTIQAESDWSRLFIYPGFQFQVVDGLLTNFHLPKTTLLMLVSAFASRDLMLNAYRQAVAERYRFFSYGDAMFLTAQEPSRGMMLGTDSAEPHQTESRGESQ